MKKNKQDRKLHNRTTRQSEREEQIEQWRQSKPVMEQTRDRYAKFYDLAPVGYLTLNQAGMIIDINLTGAAMLCVERDTLLPGNFLGNIVSMDRDKWLYNFQQIQQNNVQSCEFNLHCTNGKHFHVKLENFQQNNCDRLILMVLTDISENLSRKNKLRESEQKFRTLAEAMPQMVWITRADGGNIYFNQQWVDYTGLTLEESYGHGWNKPFHPDDRQRALDAWQHATQTNGLYSVECRLRRADGVYRWWLVRGVSQQDEHGNIINWFGTCTDITGQKKTEELLLDSIQKLGEKERAKTRFLAAAGHDLRQPVAAANLFVYALKNTQPTEEQSELIEKLTQSMNVFSDLLKQLLDILKFDAGVIKAKNGTFNLDKLCVWLDQTFSQIALNHNIKFHLFFSTRQPLIVNTDINLLRSILMNLLSNAIKFTIQGGILISARLRGARVLIQVWDTGIGISPTHLPLIFDEFYQIANQQRNREAGLGLGLSICKRAITLLGGKITCRSRQGSGSVFEFSLPLAMEERQSASHNEDILSIPRNIFSKGTRVLLLEDDELVADDMTSLLRGLGIIVRHFYSAEDALQSDDILDSDYFIVDYALGGQMTGIEFLEVAQRRQITPLHAIVITGETSSQFINSVAGKRWPLLHKPIDFEKLSRILGT
jgi:PAS domain S-box-containing protein